LENAKENRKLLKNDPWLDWAAGKYDTDQKNGVPRPPQEKLYPEDAELVDLIPAGELTVGDASVREVLARRRSRRSFSSEPLSLEELSYLLWATQGVSKIISTPAGPMALRTAPSGGARHPFETYIFINRVDGVSAGLYRYLPLEHKLLFIYSESALARKVVDACCGQPFAADAAALFVWTAIPYRTEWRYSVLSSKIIALDAGHLCENLYLAAESIGAGTCAIGAYFQEEMDELLGVDGEEEFTVYAAPVGKIED
jgi:SagB-type dehydrogenase family enzyme